MYSKSFLVYLAALTAPLAGSRSPLLDPNHASSGAAAVVVGVSAAALVRRMKDLNPKDTCMFKGSYTRLSDQNVLADVRALNGTAHVVFQVTGKVAEPGTRDFHSYYPAVEIPGLPRSLRITYIGQPGKTKIVSRCLH
jgi:hypothetical protein